MKIKDQLYRIEATNTSHSYIVQAPAGSGKTELLIQRYLKLLSVTKKPEYILIITFTKKSANEIRNRIINIIQHIIENKNSIKNNIYDTYQKNTIDYAKKALKLNKNKNILYQLHKLRILTIDALCLDLYKIFPKKNTQITQFYITDKPQHLYEKAVKNFFYKIAKHINLKNHLKLILQHVNNNQNKLFTLLINLLSNREQWISFIFKQQHINKTYYEKILSFIEKKEISNLKNSISTIYWKKIFSFVIKIINSNKKILPKLQILKKWNHYTKINQHIAKSLSFLLINSKNQLRKKINHHVGFKKNNYDNKTYNFLKNENKNILNMLQTLPKFCKILIKIKNLPSIHYPKKQWQILQSLYILLPNLITHLHTIFYQNNTVDFSYISQEILLAFKNKNQLYDLSNYIKNNIHHLLIDEFQDTSIQQYKLFKKIIKNWRTNKKTNKKTIFLVGDPMQSIYRFRQAEVGLFEKIKKEGIAHIKIKSLQLKYNFRSTINLTNWINKYCTNIFPTSNNNKYGAVKFSPSISTNYNKESNIYSKSYNNFTEESEAIANLIKQETKKNPKDKIAILIRSRSQLPQIINSLKKNNILFHGTEINPILNLPHIQDIWILTQVLLLPGNRLTWLALLRSQFCGLSISDIYHIANFSQKKSIYQTLLKIDNIPKISNEGKYRTKFIFKHIHNALNQRYQQPLVHWIINILKKLHIKHILTQEEEEDLEKFWELIEQFNVEGKFINLNVIEKELKKLYSHKYTTSQIEIMTIHKAKGLEFDSIILPYLSYATNKNINPLFRYLKIPEKNFSKSPLIYPIENIYNKKHISLYDYIKNIDKKKDFYELQRLLYVALTRAKKNIYLFDHKKKESQFSFRSLLKKQKFILNKQNLKTNIKTYKIQSLLYKLPQKYYINPSYINKKSISCKTNKIKIHITNSINKKEIGTIIHELLEWICNNHPNTIKQLPWNNVKKQLKSLGLDLIEQKTIYKQILLTIKKSFNNPIAKWIFKNHHKEKNEYKMLVKINKKISTKIIDRMFIYQNKSWIIDYKTGNLNNKKHHIKQINDYAKLITNNHKYSIYCGIFYLNKNLLIYWKFKSINNSF
ncbi:UvrD-helicase domain-containing protein [Candidatus Legionella polyplacis]|uniref:DNA 3'-5' helicase n=1 Tax=Candidatus Legionella polyplacis TaxID=2005262 RepID=A0ABZ2GW28_9GAMM